MHFLFTARRYHTNQRFAVKALLDAGHRVSFAATVRGLSEVYDELEPIMVGAIRMPQWTRKGSVSWPEPFDFWKTMRELRPDVVVVRDAFTTFGTLAVASARALRAKVVLYSQNPMHRRIALWKVIANSLTARAASARHMTPVLGCPKRYRPPFGALMYVPFVMEPQTSPGRKAWFGCDALNVITVGKFVERKNHAMFLRAIARLAERYPIRATIVGECEAVEARKLLSRIVEIRNGMGLGDRVQIKTNLSYHEVQREYAAHDLFVLPSSDEPAAVSHLEAMSHSLPVICSDSNGTACYIRQGENGYVFRSGDQDDLERCIESIIASRSRLMEMGESSYRLVISEHSPAKYVETMEALARGEG